MVIFFCETDIFIDLHGSHPSLPTNLKNYTISNNTQFIIQSKKTDIHPHTQCFMAQLSWTNLQ